MEYGYLTTPIGTLRIGADHIGVCEVDFTDEIMDKEDHNPFIQQAKLQLQEYFNGVRKRFDLPLHIKKGTAFQRLCWNALSEIPYGETRSYYEQAVSIRKPKAVRAVGGANHHNPIVIIIPCHRVIAKNGTLCGYGGGLSRKEYLLRLEAGEINE